MGHSLETGAFPRDCPLFLVAPFWSFLPDPEVTLHSSAKKHPSSPEPSQTFGVFIWRGQSPETVHPFSALHPPLEGTDAHILETSKPSPCPTSSKEVPPLQHCLAQYLHPNANRLMSVRRRSVASSPPLLPYSFVPCTVLASFPTHTFAAPCCAQRLSPRSLPCACTHLFSLPLCPLEIVPTALHQEYLTEILHKPLQLESRGLALAKEVYGLERLVHCCRNPTPSTREPKSSAPCVLGIE